MDRYVPEVNKAVQWRRGEWERNSLWRTHRSCNLCRPFTCTQTYMTHYRKGKPRTNRAPLTLSDTRWSTNLELIKVPPPHRLHAGGAQCDFIALWKQFQQQNQAGGPWCFQLLVCESRVRARGWMITNSFLLCLLSLWKHELSIIQTGHMISEPDLWGLSAWSFSRGSLGSKETMNSCNMIQLQKCYNWPLSYLL